MPKIVLVLDSVPVMTKTSLRLMSELFVLFFIFFSLAFTSKNWFHYFKTFKIIVQELSTIICRFLQSSSAGSSRWEKRLNAQNLTKIVGKYMMKNVTFSVHFICQSFKMNTIMSIKYNFLLTHMFKTVSYLYKPSFLLLLVAAHNGLFSHWNQ